MCRRTGRELSVFPILHNCVKAIRAFHGLSPKVDASFFRRGDALRLPLQDKLPLGLRYIAQQLQNDV